MEFQRPTCCLEGPGVPKGEMWATSWPAALSKALPISGLVFPSCREEVRRT